MTVLILGQMADCQVDAVTQELSKLGAEFSCFRAADFLAGAKTQFTMMPQSNSGLMQLPSGAMIDLARVEAIWFRRPSTNRSYSCRMTFSGLPQSWLNSIVEKEGESALAGILRSLNCLFVNHPGRDYDCSSKLWQLEAAKRVGMAVPKTLVTNMPESVMDFYEQCGGNVIYKLIGERTLVKMPFWGIPTADFGTQILKQDDLAHLGQVRTVPHLFQERIDKRFDIRVTVIGKKLFPVKIESQAGKGAIDWRKDYSVSMEPIDLPADIGKACFELLEQLGLNFGAVDMCVDENGRHVFFEVNYAGQYSWLEQKIKGLKLSLELAKLLIGESEPIIPRAPFYGNSGSFQ